MIETEKKKQNGGYKYIKPPTLNELNKFREVQFLQHSNLFRLQIDEMLSTLEIKTTKKTKINSWSNEFSQFVKSLPKSKSYKLNDQNSLEENGLSVPFKFCSDFPDLGETFTFIPPKEIEMIGSYPLGHATTHCRNIDVALVLCKESLHKFDIYNWKWLVKRALFLSFLGKSLQMNTDLVSAVSWTYHCGSHLRPILQVTPAGKLGKGWTVNIFPIPPEDFFKINKLSPNKNNVSDTSFLGREKKDGETLPPTPHHNWLCGVDVVMMKHFNFIKSNLTHPNWIQGLKLLKVWLSQRSLNQGEGAITSHFMTLLVIHLAKTRKISPQMSVYQVFRTTLLHLSQTDWRIEGPVMETGPVTDRNLVYLQSKDFLSFYPVVFVDPSGFFNVAGNVLKEVYSQLVYESKMGLEILELSSTNSFDALFIRKMELPLAFDQLVRIRFTKKILKQIFDNKTDAETAECVSLDHLGDFRSKAFSHVISLLSYGLGERVVHIGMIRDPSPTWEYGSSSPDFDYNLFLGLLVNQRLFSGLLTKGPSADSKEAEEFREFWGDISSLRRFRDSTFHEAVLWLENNPSMGDRRAILGKIITYIMKRHLDLKESRITYISNQLEKPLRVDYVVDGEGSNYGTGEEAVTAAIISFDKLAKKLRSLELPLKVTGVQSPSEVLRHSVVFPPMPTMVLRPKLNNTEESANKSPVVEASEKFLNRYRSVIEVQIFLEVSGKWPDDLVAIDAIKAEFLRKVCELLEKEGITAVVVRRRCNSLFIVWEGYLFSLKICYRKEILLLRESRSEEEVESSRMLKDASIILERDIEILPKLTSSLSSLQADFPSYGSSVRIVKRWVSSQLLLPHFPPIVVDLLVAHIFLNPHPFKAPSCPQVALLRFWDLICGTDWKSTPIMLNLRNEFNENDETELTERFTNFRGSFPPMFICTPCELRPLAGGSEPTKEDVNKRYKLASCWTMEEPSLPILGRVKVVAEAALNTFRSSVWEDGFDFLVFFRPPYDLYDVLIHLDGKKLVRRGENVEYNEVIYQKSYKHAKGELLPPSEFDPVQCYLNELRVAFDDYALFFHDEHGGEVIGVLFKPHVMVERKPKFPNVEGTKIVGVNDVKLVVNLNSITDEFRILGCDIVDRIELKS